MTNLELGTLLQAIITMEDKMPEGVLWKLDYEAFVAAFNSADSKSPAQSPTPGKGTAANVSNPGITSTTKGQR